MKRLPICLICCGLAFLGGCLPGMDLGNVGSVDYYAVDVAYNLSSVVVTTPMYDPQLGGPEPYEELWPISAIISSGASVMPANVTLAGDTISDTLQVGVEIVLNDAQDMILSVSATRIKTSGVEGEWTRNDSILATNIPLVDPEAGQSPDISVYRLTGAAICSAVSFLDYRNVRSSTAAVPETGPSQVVKNTGVQQCSETSYIEITIEAVH